MTKVVVVGGGVAGATVAKDLQDDADVTLIDTKEFFEIRWATPRALVEPGIAPRIFILHSEYAPRAHLEQGLVERASTKDVTLQDGRIFPYDFLVLATGMKPDPALPLQERIAGVDADFKKLQDAKEVLVVGGGPTGVELAAEVATDFPDKKVTLVHGGPRLLEFVGEAAGAKALAWLQGKGVTVKLNEKVDISNGKWGASGTFRTKTGEDIKTDFLCLAIGGRPQQAWLRQAFSVVSEGGFVNVEPTLQVVGYKNVFAAGDIVNLKDMKQGYLASAQAQVVAHNIRQLMKADGKEARLKEHPAQPEVALVSLGRSDGLMQAPFVGTFTGWLPAWLKSKDLFVTKTRKDLGLKT